MPEDFGGDASDDRIRISQPIQRGTDRGSILPETAKGLFLAVKEMWVALPAKPR